MRPSAATFFRNVALRTKSLSTPAISNPYPKISEIWYPISIRMRHQLNTQKTGSGYRQSMGNVIPMGIVHGNVIPMGIPWETSHGMGWDRHKLLWDGNGTDKYVLWTTLVIGLPVAFIFGNLFIRNL